MKRKRFFVILVSLISGLLIYIGANSIVDYPLLGENKSKEYIKEFITGHEGELLPNIELLLPDSSTIINIASIPSGKPTVLFYFGPYCEYCQLEMIEIVSNMRHMENIQFYLISPYHILDIRRFIDAYHLGKYPNITIGVDFKFKFGEYYKAKNIPYLAIYNSDKKLNAAFVGNVKYDQIKSISGK
ncbi:MULTISPECIES: TlpA family protein disulfide reductase [unclassified Chitinophaga]|uniref:TlpA family protein disulfide reductase n=1 Tax=unclassified Chitinophaga TaxID=2619133 RepID=UPI0030101E97